MMDDTFYGSTFNDQMIFCTFHTYLNLGMSEEATVFYKLYLNGVSVYCDVGQTLLAWDQCFDQQKSYDAFLEIIDNQDQTEQLV